MLALRVNHVRMRKSARSTLWVCPLEFFRRAQLATTQDQSQQYNSTWRLKLTVAGFSLGDQTSWFLSKNQVSDLFSNSHVLVWSGTNCLIAPSKGHKRATLSILNPFTRTHHYPW